MKVVLTVMLLVIVLTVLPGVADGRSVKAYFNGQEATVSGITLNKGERFTVDLYAVPDGEADVWAEIDEPGEPRAYCRISGDELTPEAFKPCNASAGARFHWELAAGGDWAGGTAPLNAYYQINGRNSNNVIARGYFTVVEAYISPENPVADMDNNTGATDKNAEKTPWPGLITCLACIVVAMLTRTKSLI
jgi:sarcinarray family protein